jgi:hypothetical protein
MVGCPLRTGSRSTKTTTRIELVGDPTVATPSPLLSFVGPNMNTIVVTIPCLHEGFSGTKVTPNDIDWGTEREVTFPSKKAVCSECMGYGRTLSASIRHHAYTREDLDEDPEFAKEYLKGGEGIYGVTCPTCGGRNVVDVIDTSHPSIDPMDLQVHDIAREIDERDRRDEERTYRMESGDWGF